MTPAQLAEAVLAAAEAALADQGRYAPVPPGAARVERSRNPADGGYASVVALQLAKSAGLAPRDLAGAIGARLSSHPAIRDVQVAGPGFLNIRLHDAAAGALAGTIIRQGDEYGRGAELACQQVNLEFASANPTGPVHLGGVWSRLWLADATQVVVASGLGLLGVTAPERL